MPEPVETPTGQLELAEDVCGVLGEWVVQVGDVVRPGDLLAMVNLQGTDVPLSVYASRAGRVNTLYFAVGDTIESG